MTTTSSPGDARDRIDNLFQPGTFQESGLHAQHDCHNFGMEEKTMPADGVITGTGWVDARTVAAFSQDFTVGGGALGLFTRKKSATPWTSRSRPVVP